MATKKSNSRTTTKTSSSIRSARRDHERHLLHHAIAELSFTGTVARSLLMFLLGLAVLVTQLIVFYAGDGTQSLSSGAGQTDYLLPTVQSFVFLVGGFIVFDMLYMFVRRLYPLPALVDRTLVFLVEIGFIGALLLPVFTTLSWSVKPAHSLIIILSPVFVLAVRVLLGIAARQMKLR